MNTKSDFRRMPFFSINQCSRNRKNMMQKRVKLEVFSTFFSCREIQFFFSLFIFLVPHVNCYLLVASRLTYGLISYLANHLFAFSIQGNKFFSEAKTFSAVPKPSSRQEQHFTGNSKLSCLSIIKLKIQTRWKNPRNLNFMFLAAVHHLKTTLYFAWALKKPFESLSEMFGNNRKLS